MIVAGASSHAKEVLQILNALEKEDFTFFDDVSVEIDPFFNSFSIVRSLDEINTGEHEFVLALGDPQSRKIVFEKLSGIGLKPASVIAPTAVSGRFRSFYGEGLNIMHHSFISNGVQIGKGCLINVLVSVHHDTILGDFVEVSPGASILGGCQIGSLTSIGAGARILPDVIIGSNCKVGAGSVVLNDLPDNAVAVGVPAKVIKHNG